MPVQRFTKKTQILDSLKNNFATHKIFVFTGYLLLSWIYAACSQIIIPLPFNLVPLSIQPAPLFIATFLFGWHAVNAYILYLAQGACGLPFFAGLQGGLIRLLGPTGGYLIGFGLGMALIATLRRYTGQSTIKIIAVILAAESITFAFGLFQLAWFVPVSKILSAGLYPFVIGDFIIKVALVFSCLKLRQFVMR